MYETAEQADWIDPLGCRVQVSEPKLPDESVKSVTVPIGLVAPDAGPVSVTVGVQWVAVPTTVGLGVHDKLVLVAWMMTVCVTFPSWAFCGRTVP